GDVEAKARAGDDTARWAARASDSSIVATSGMDPSLAKRPGETSAPRRQSGDRRLRFVRPGELRQMPPGDVHRIVTAREVRLHAAAFPVAAGMAVDRASIRDGDLETVAHRHRLADQVGGAGAAAAD